MLAGAAAAIFPAALFAQSAPAPAATDQFALLQGELRRTHESGDSAAYLATARSMYSFLNGSPRATLQLMSAESFAAKPDEALQSFAQFVTMGQANEEVFKAKSFDPLRGIPRYQDIYAGMVANATGESTASEVFRLHSSARIPEDIDYDPETKDFYISTVLGKQILEVTMAGHTKLFAGSPDQWPMMGPEDRLTPPPSVGDRSGIGRVCGRRQGGLGKIRDSAIRPAFRKACTAH
jgi:hypothetical protein